jgi:hypothetical protein
MERKCLGCINVVGLQLEGFDRNNVGLISKRALDFYDGKLKKPETQSRPLVSPSLPATSTPKPNQYGNGTQRPMVGSVTSRPTVGSVKGSNVSRQGLPEPAQISVRTIPKFVPSIVSKPAQHTNLARFNDSSTGVHMRKISSHKAVDLQLAKILSNVQRDVARRPPPTAVKRSIDVITIPDDRPRKKRKEDLDFMSLPVAQKKH